MRDVSIRQLATAFCLSVGLLWATIVLADDVSIRPIALFKDKAMLSINGQRAKIIKVGEKIEGVTLVAATTEEAIVEIDGRRETITLNGGVVLSQSLGTKVPDNPDARVQVWADQYGFFRSRGAINGKNLEFLVDTGANLVVLSSQHAERIDLEYKDGQRARASTASGTAPMYILQLDEVSFEGITLRDVRAGVIVGAFPEIPLLGMSFLKSVDMSRTGNVMVLKKRF